MHSKRFNFFLASVIYTIIVQQMQLISESSLYFSLVYQVCCLVTASWLIGLNHVHWKFWVLLVLFGDHQISSERTQDTARWFGIKVALSAQEWSLFLLLGCGHFPVGKFSWKNSEVRCECWGRNRSSYTRGLVYLRGELEKNLEHSLAKLIVHNSIDVIIIA